MDNGDVHPILTDSSKFTATSGSERAVRRANDAAVYTGGSTVDDCHGRFHGTLPRWPPCARFPAALHATLHCLLSRCLEQEVEEAVPADAGGDTPGGGVGLPPAAVDVAPPVPNVHPAEGVVLPIDVDRLPLQVIPCERREEVTASGKKRVRLHAAGGLTLEYIQCVGKALMGKVYHAGKCGPAPGYELTRSE